MIAFRIRNRRRLSFLALVFGVAAAGLSFAGIALASSPVSATLTCGSSYPYQAAARASISGVQRFISTENTYSACYYVYLNGNATGSTYYVNPGGWVPGWQPLALWDVGTDQSVYDIQGTHNVCQTSSGTICNPVWVYTHAY